MKSSGMSRGGMLLLASVLMLGASDAFAMGKKHPSDPVVHIPASNRNYLKVLSLNFNSEDVLADSNENLREQRFAALVDWVLKNDADVLMLQEAWNFRGEGSVAKALARALDYDVHYRIGMGEPGLFYDSNIILAKKQYRMSELQEYKLAHSAWDVGDGKDWTIVFGRVTYGLGVKLTLADGEPVYVYTTHLIGADDQERLDQVRDFQEKIRNHIAADGQDPSRARIIFGGDLNFFPVGQAVDFLRSEGFQDTFDQAHPGDTSCTDCANPSLPFFNPITIGSGLFPDQSDETESQRTDFVFTHGPLTTLASSLHFSAPFETVWMSDHYGMFSIIGTGGAIAETIPNPVHDAEAAAQEATVLQVDKSFFRGSQIPELKVRNSRGLVVRNALGGTIQVLLKGPGTILTKPDAQLEKDHSAAFAFDTNGTFSLTVLSSAGGMRVGTVRVHME